MQYLRKFSHRVRLELEVLLEDAGGHFDNDVWLAGGAAKACVLNEPYSDLDFSFRSEDALFAFSEYLQKRGSEVIYASDDVIAYTPVAYSNIQLSRFAYYDSPQAVIDDFDFTLSKFIVDFNDNVLYSKEDKHDAVNKILRVNKIQNPHTVFLRIQKFINAGYVPCDGFWMDVCTGIKNIDLERFTFSLDA